MPMAPEKRMYECVHWRSPAELRSTGWKVWPKPPSQIVRMSSFGFPGSDQMVTPSGSCLSPMIRDVLTKEWGAWLDFGNCASGRKGKVMADRVERG